MDPSLLATLSRLLDEALDRAPGERMSWLDDLGPEYDTIKPRLRRLLTGLPGLGTSGFLGTLPRLEAIGESAEDSEIGSAWPIAGTPIGPYRLVRQIGEGGMASVWLGERVDGLLNRPVAIKLPRVGWHRADLVARVGREREILAALNHPNIARIYDAGLTVDGHPYLALEYVEGRPIDEYCRIGSLDGRARVRLFLQVARAVSHAHAKLVIHRDLKPSNILVTADGQVRLLDFGIAKLLEEGQATDSTLTALAGRALTPDYASPEQIAGARLGVASDVYSLGVVLYELLAGTRPYALRRGSGRGLEEAILQAVVSRPSDAAVDMRARKSLRGDLDTILLKALKKTAEERYPTVEGLVDDLERYLHSQPVRARSESAWSGVRKFVARNRLAVGASAAVVVAVLAGSGIALWQMFEANRQRDVARQQQQRAEAFSSFMSILLQDAGAGDRQLRTTELLDRATEILDRQQDLDEAVAASMRYEISRSYLLFNNTDRELALLERSADGARRLGDGDLLAASECSAAWSLAPRDRAAAEVKLTGAQRVMSAATNVSALTRADCLRAQSRLFSARGDMTSAIAAAEEALALLDDREVQTWSRRDLLTTQLSDLYRATDRFKESLALSEKTLANLRRSGRTGSLQELTALNNYAGNLYRLGEVAPAAVAQDQALQLVERSARLGIQPVGLRNNVGFTRLRLWDAKRALELAEADQVLAEREGSVGGVALSHLLASRALLRLERVQDARRRLGMAESIWQRDAVMNQRVLQEAALHRAEIHLVEGNLSEAGRLIDSTLSQLGYADRKDAAGLDRVLRLGAAIRLRAGRPAEAETLAADALAVSRRLARDERHSADAGEAALLLARARADRGLHAQAARDAAFAADALRYGLGPGHPETLGAIALSKRLETGGPHE